MKKTYPVSNKVRGNIGWHVHLRKEGKRRANKATRRALKSLEEAAPGRDLGR
jgi:hypothetical protein